jgi:hypothetical protein
MNRDDEITVLDIDWVLGSGRVWVERTGTGQTWGRPLADAPGEGPLHSLLTKHLNYVFCAIVVDVPVEPVVIFLFSGSDTNRGCRRDE